MPVGLGNVTAQTLTVTKQAQEYFQQAQSDLMRIVGNVLDEGSGTLTSQMLISDAGTRFGGAVQQWTTQAMDIGQQFQNMIDFLGEQIQIMLQNEHNGVDLANGLSKLALPG
jgi:hypothetical protein